MSVHARAGIGGMTASLALLLRDIHGDDEARGRFEQVRGRDDRRADAASMGRDDVDASVVQRIRAGDRAAFDALVAAHFAQLSRCAYIVTRARDDAEDVAQEVFVDVWLRRAQWSPNGSVRAYLLTAARHRALNRTRRIGVEARHMPSVRAMVTPSSEMAPDEAMLTDETARMLTVALDRLPARTREAVLLRYEAECTFPDVAQVLGMSLPAAQKLVQRALAQLRTMLAEMIRAGDRPL